MWHREVNRIMEPLPKSCVIDFGKKVPVSSATNSMLALLDETLRIGSAPYHLTYKTKTTMQYIFIVALEFILAFAGVALFIRYYNHKA